MSILPNVGPRADGPLLAHEPPLAPARNDWPALGRFPTGSFQETEARKLTSLANVGASAHDQARRLLLPRQRPTPPIAIFRVDRGYKAGSANLATILRFGLTR